MSSDKQLGQFIFLALLFIFNIFLILSSLLSYHYQRLQENFAQYSHSQEITFSPEMIPAYLMPFLFSSQNVKKLASYSN